MNKPTILAFLLIFAAAITQAQEIGATSKISEVTVYRNLAKETRTASVTVPSGYSEVLLSGVTTVMTDQSLQVSVKGDATLLSATVRINYFTEDNLTPENSKSERLRDSIEKLNLDLRWSSQERSILEGELALVNELLKPTLSKEGYKPTDMNAMADIYHTRVAELRNKIFSVTLKEENISAKIYKYESQLGEMSVKAKDPVKEIVLSFSSDKSESIQLFCSYLVASAGWAPMYDIHVENTTKPVDLTYKARLFQNTGFDWKDVMLTVSSSNPSLDNNRPLMSPKYIEYATYTFKPMLDQGSISNMMQAERNYNVQEQTIDPSKYLVDVNESDIQVEFALATKQTIASDGKEHICKLQMYEVPATYKYHTVPKLDPGAFLMARITDYGQYNLLAGDANIFFGDTYVGQVALNPQIIADTLLVSLGRDERIVVKRVRVQDKFSKGLFSGVEKDTYAYKTTIRNNKGFPIEIEILDQIPLTRREEIKVKLLDKSGADYDLVYGKLLWNIKVKANESKNVDLVYTVEYPEGKKVAEQ